MAAVCAPEDELTYLLAGTVERRAHAQRRVAALASRASWSEVAGRLRPRGLLPLFGSRLLEFEDVEVPGWFRDEVAAVRDRQRHKAALVEVESLRLWRALEDAGIRTAVLKGPFMAEELYGDPGLRPSNDVDLLVSRQDFPRALALLEGSGYQAVKGGAWSGGLPLFETTLRPPQEWRPAVDLHWRVHWYEELFSEGLLEASEPGDGLPRRPEGLHLLAALLLFYCRDGFMGMRPAADVAAWWDRHGADLPPDGMAPLAERYPRLARCFGAGLMAAEHQVGVPASRVLAASWAQPAPAARASRLAQWGGGDPLAYQAAVALVDLLLAPPGEHFPAVQRHVLPPAEAITRIYGLRKPSVLAGALSRLRFAALVGGRLLPWQAQALWASRGGRHLAPTIG